MSVVNLLAQDKNIILYRKELNSITGSVTATILLQQLIYWFNQNNNEPFYKFIEPCNNEKYTDGDSWTEELGFTKKEFMGAYKKLEAIGVVSKRITMDRVTYYSLHLDILNDLIDGIYLSDKRELTKCQKVTYESDKRELMKVTKGHLDYSKSFDTETTTETTTDIKEKDKKEIPTIFELWNNLANELNLHQISKMTSKRKNKLSTRLKENSNFLEEFKTALENIKQSNFLQGKNQRNWKVDFDWLIANDTNFIKVLEGKYTDISAPVQQSDFSKFGSVPKDHFAIGSVIDVDAAPQIQIGANYE